MPVEPPTKATVPRSTLSADMPDPTFALIALLREDLKGMREMMISQQERINRLEQHQRDADIALARESTSQPPTDTNPGPSKVGKSIPKEPQIHSFSGKTEDQTSTKAKSFIYSFQKVGALSCMSEQDMLALADCYLNDAAAKWMMHLESSDSKPTSLTSLQSKMMAEFVPAD